MSKAYFYKAFGLTIESCTPIAQLLPIEPCESDVRIVWADFSDLPRERRKYTNPDGIFFHGYDNCYHRITGGNLIEVQRLEDYKESQLGVYLMGSCMGAILIQRGFMLLHGSCVTDGKHAILITGDSGAGKSTTAAEFLKRGWKLVTDDVTCVYERDGVFMVRSSYPSQKLWQDALDRYEKKEEDIHSLYFDQDREKFGVNVAESFFDGVCPLSMVGRLMPDDQPCSLRPMEGMTKTDQLLRNTYRIKMIRMEDMQRHFQRCVTLSTKVPMALAIREKGKDCAPLMYEKITQFLEEHYHD